MIVGGIAGAVQEMTQRGVFDCMNVKDYNELVKAADVSERLMAAAGERVKRLQDVIDMHGAPHVQECAIRALAAVPNL